jgi:beta-xylosidase
LKITFDFRNSRDRANFYYSLDGVEWTRFGKSLTMRYTLDHFMGYRIALFNYATIQPGGYIDIDYFHSESPAASL